MDSQHESRICPFLQANDDRCARQFTLQHLNDMFRYCLGQPGDCRIYHQIRTEQQGNRVAAASAVR